MVIQILTLSQILAWNGGGKSNYTEIIHEGSWSKSADMHNAVNDEDDEDVISIPGIEIDISGLKDVKETISVQYETGEDMLREKIADISQKVNELVEEELDGFFSRN